uniref:Phosphatidylinositol-specific phospholipase C X domain-containing protein n=1 Tax=Chromera velia CCMP2878 TaxID=1169474 RepID=A0A0G4I3Q5_9ALVE|mmetsp:Transcript_56140/g.109908  ORF Transcript_56140/g.109908 Transcript_56140/m.109908 type:complete len:592 (-) Transcript_56140:134-1909(-)|eukprot:Cvel_1753.t1-p1 / transcript=Cvel_1753.t1 / gene=Cvel_1753 / organism=Chromera_velia_CCMP2878 / gene_product=hypothetical protein / transcript_product=hypothetical protein / location=Cvel_scaffold64:47099-50342(-) / protein_length=591 / sequence_SO=supercontig / SO=protein_coding / is_pseudo=false
MNIRLFSLTLLTVVQGGNNTEQQHRPLLSLGSRREGYLQEVAADITSPPCLNSTEEAPEVTTPHGPNSSSSNDPNPLPACPLQACNGVEGLCNAELADVVFPGTHNSLAYNLSGCSFHGLELDSLCPFFWENQRDSLMQQLEGGVRAFDLDFCWREDRPVACHAGATRNESASEIFASLADWLSAPENECEVLLMRLSNADSEQTRRRVATDIFGGPLSNFVYVNAEGAGGAVRMSELIGANKRVVVLFTPDSGFSRTLRGLQGEEGGSLGEVLSSFRPVPSFWSWRSFDLPADIQTGMRENLGRSFCEGWRGFCGGIPECLSLSFNASSSLGEIKKESKEPDTAETVTLLVATDEDEQEVEEEEEGESVQIGEGESAETSVETVEEGESPTGSDRDRSPKEIEGGSVQGDGDDLLREEEDQELPQASASSLHVSNSSSPSEVCWVGESCACGQSNEDGSRRMLSEQDADLHSSISGGCCVERSLANWALFLPSTYPLSLREAAEEITRLVFMGSLLSDPPPGVPSRQLRRLEEGEEEGEATGNTRPAVTGLFVDHADLEDYAVVAAARCANEALVGQREFPTDWAECVRK